jgi:hypothetical protein
MSRRNEKLFQRHCFDYRMADYENAAHNDLQSPPILSMPVTKEEILAVLLQYTGTQFKPEDIRMIPAALSGALNGGVIVEVGGDPNNALSWAYNFVFDKNGKLAYYGKGRSN